MSCSFLCKAGRAEPVQVIVLNWLAHFTPGSLSGKVKSGQVIFLQITSVDTMRSMSAQQPYITGRTVYPVIPADYATGAHAAAVVTYGAPGVRRAHAIDGGVVWSYSGSGTLAGGKVTIADGGAIVAEFDITSPGPGYMPWRGSISPNAAMTVTIADGSANVTGKVSVFGHHVIDGVSVTNGIDFSDPDNSWWLAIL